MNAIYSLRNNSVWHFLAFIFLAFALLSEPARAAGYVASITTAYPQLAIPSTATMVRWYGGNCGNTVNAANPYVRCDDGVSPVIPIGFTFNYAGVAYNNWSMSSNGVIFFETGAPGTASTGGTTYTPSNLPTNAFGAGKPALMPFWADLWKSASANNVLDADAASQPASASFIQYQTLAVSGAQVLVIQLKKVGFYGAAGTLVNMQIQLWSTGQIVYSYGAMQAMTTNPALRIGLQTGGTSGGCNTLSTNQSTSLSNQSFVFVWDAAAAACTPLTVVNHYEIRHDGAATQCAEPISVLACSSATAPCPAGNIMSNAIIIGNISVTGAGVTNVTLSPPSVTIQAATPIPSINLSWAPGSAGTAALGVSATLAATGAVRCITANGATVRPNCDMTVTNTACVPPPHHFEIQGPANGTDCASSAFTIKAWADAGQTIAYTSTSITSGTLISSGNAASIPNLGAFTIPPGSSTVNITPINFPAVGNTNFNATGTTISAATCNFGGSTSCILPVNACVSDFNCVETVANAATPADTNSQTGRLYTKLAGTAFSFDVVARKSDGSQATAYAASANKSVTVSLVDGSGATVCTSRGALTPAQSQTLNFSSTDQGRKTATFTVNNAYGDLRCRATDSTITGCSSDNFAIRPVITLTNTATAAPPPSTTAASNTPAIKAGAGFTLYPTSSAGTNYTSILTLDTAKLTAQDPANTALANGGTIGSLTPATLASNPATAPSGNATYSEVGYLYLAQGAYYDNASPPFTSVDAAANDCVTGSFSTTLSGGKYGCKIGTEAITLGRFTPHHFDTVVTQGCGAFTYSGQPFQVTVTAKNGNTPSAKTENYIGNFAKAVTLGYDGAGTCTPTTTNFANNSLAATAFLASDKGVASTPAISNALAIKYTQTLASPTTGSVCARDADAVDSHGYTQGNLAVRNGRLRLSNAYGLVSPLAMPVQAQFWSGLSWVSNTDDSCTTLTGIFSTPPANWAWPAASPPAPASTVTLGAGKGTLYLSGPKPGAATVTTSGNLPAWLTPAPSAKANIGIYGTKESRKAVHIRETY